MNSNDAEQPRRLEKRLAAGALLLLLIGCFVVMRPFLSAMLWAIVLSFALWPIQRRLVGWMGQRRTPAALVTTLGVALLLVVPFIIIGVSLRDDVRALGTATRKLVDTGPPAAPAWVEKVPLVGRQAKMQWNELAADASRWLKSAKQAAVETASSTNEIARIQDATAPAENPGATAIAQESRLPAMVGRLVASVRTWFVKAGLAIGRGVLEVTLSAVLTFFILRDGAAMAERLTTGMKRIAGDRGQHLLEVAGKTVRGVVYGILGTALLQGALAGIGFLIAGVPGAALLGLLTFFLSAIPMGPPLVWIPAAIWLFQQDSTGWGIFMVVWGLIVSSVDNVVKPWLISQGSNMPFVLIFFGVLGGALAFGFIGVFLGPTLLAVAYRLVEEWSANVRAAEAALEAPAEPAAPAE